ncbi:hypothetical protein HOY82DRAFT_460945, partial [Tuber indicum]
MEASPALGQHPKQANSTCTFKCPLPTMSSDSKKRLALAIIDFLSTSTKDGTVSDDDKESVDVAQQCIADAFKVDPTDRAAMIDALAGQSLQSIY